MEEIVTNHDTGYDLKISRVMQWLKKTQDSTLLHFSWNQLSRKLPKCKSSQNYVSRQWRRSESNEGCPPELQSFFHFNRNDRLSLDQNGISLSLSENIHLWDKLLEDFRKISHLESSVQSLDLELATKEHQWVFKPLISALCF